MKIWLHIALIAIALHTANRADGQRLQDWLLLGDRAMAENDPYGALQYYGEAMNIDSAKGEVNYKYAEALRKNQNYSKAAYYYAKVYRRDYGKIYTEGGAHLAGMQKQSGNYKAAKKSWRRVRDQYADKPSSYWYQKAVQEMRACDLATEWINEEALTEIEKASTKVNSEASEFAGVFDNQYRLIFTSLRGQFDDKGRLTGDPEAYVPRIYRADSSLSAVTPLELPSENENVFNYSFSDKESRIAFATKDRERNYQILIFSENSSQPERIIPELVDSAWYSQPAFGEVNDREVLFFASDRAGGFGREDIWYVYLDNPNSKPINAGENINTRGSELSPFYRKDTQKLYFASDWHYGLGGYDIFTSDEIEGVFSFPENMKKPFNSPANDLYYSFNKSIGKGSLTSNRMGATAPEGSGCCNDLWLFAQAKESRENTLPEITSLEELNDYLPVVLYFHNDEPNPRTRKEETRLNYLETYRAYVNLLPEYEMAYREGLSRAAGDRAEEKMDEFFRESIDRGVENLQLFTELLAGELAEGQNIELTVKGFASPLAETDYNVKLTSRRISSLINYLEAFDRGALRPYIDGTAPNGGELKIVKIPFGEYTASEFVSDNPNENNAIYSIAAARERKIEIVSVQRLLEDTALAEINFQSEILDLKGIAATDSIAFSFTFSAGENLEIDSIGYNPEMLSIDEDSETNNDEKLLLDGRISGILHPRNAGGKQNIVITLYGNIPGGRKELNLTFEIEEKP